jgi:molecular chaperone DnaJ
MSTAALGGVIEVPSIDGTKAKVTINPGTQYGDKFRLRAKGMPAMRSPSNRGDMYIHVSIETPVNLDKRQKELLEEFEKISSDKNTNPKCSSFFSKIKDFLGDL